MVSALFFAAFLVKTWAAVQDTSEYARALARARTPQEIERLNQEHSRLLIAKTACEIELREQAAPVSCYEAVELETPRATAEKSARRARLDRLCARAANELRLSEPTPFVSKACAGKLREARDIQSYRDEEQEEDSAWSRY